jgi:hypothetical protein
MMLEVLQGKKTSPQEKVFISVVQGPILLNRPAIGYRGWMFEMMWNLPWVASGRRPTEWDRVARESGIADD